MGKPSKEWDILNLFFEEPTKYWHFSKIKEKVPIVDNKISRWLKIFIKKKLIKKINPKKKMPYYVSNYDSFEYQNLKRLYAFKELQASGFLNHLLSLKKAKTIIIFGSLIKGDWYKESDIDLFIFGKDDGLNLVKYENILGREIQVFKFKDKVELKKFNPELLRNVIMGNLIKGNLNFLEVSINV